ncbi:MAG: hypothetical protein COA70_03320 [Planctomycetota bacterium]|nr:MAG: hypothetical protein COA70_03320 [Planctomycetota bacterium]
MNELYLFDPSTEPSADDGLLLSLEQDLQGLRWCGELPVMNMPPARKRVVGLGWRSLTGIVAAASLLVVGMLWLVQFTTQPSSPFRWNDLAGVIQVQEGWMVGASLDFDTLIETNAEDEIELSIADVGEVRLGPNGRLRIKPPLDAFGDGRFRLELLQGEMEVWVIAPARAFLVETPWFEVWDLGCQYRIEIDAIGNGEISVQLGAVQFVGGGQSIRLAPGDVLRLSQGRALTD